MEADIREFLQKYSADDLATRGILRGQTLLLNARSVNPLINLMVEQGITILEAKELGWYITSSGEFVNHGSSEFTEGNIEDLENPGNVFNFQNIHINPYYIRWKSDTGREGSTENYDAPSGVVPNIFEASEIRFGLERDLQRALRESIAQLESGLAITDGGSEKTVEAGRIDITAEDGNGNITVIELKAGTAQPDAIAQLLAYMGTIENPDSKPVRGILVANDFAPRVIQAAKAVPSISLKAYSFQFNFRDV